MKTFELVYKMIIVSVLTVLWTILYLIGYGDSYSWLFTFVVFNVLDWVYDHLFIKNYMGKF